MSELLATERAYVKDLEICVATFLHEARTSRAVPIGETRHGRVAGAGALGREGRGVVGRRRAG